MFLSKSKLIKEAQNKEIYLNPQIYKLNVTILRLISFFKIFKSINKQKLGCPMRRIRY